MQCGLVLIVAALSKHAQLQPDNCTTVMNKTSIPEKCSFLFRAAKAHGPVCIAEKEFQSRDGRRASFRLAVRARDDVVSSELLRGSKGFEETEMAAFGALMRPHTVVLDIGSNIGWWTFKLATEYEVHSFEPFPANLALQNLSKCLNVGLADNIVTYPVGLYKKEPARCEMYSSAENLGDTHTVCGSDDELQSKRGGTMKGLHLRGSAEMRVLDNLVPLRIFEADKIIKIDVEGSELLALRGATRLLTSGRPPRAILIEVVWFRNTARKELYQFLDSYGYMPVQRIGYNFIFVHKHSDHMTWHERSRASQPATQREIKAANSFMKSECNDFCAFHRPPDCNATCGTYGKRICCEWWEE